MFRNRLYSTLNIYFLHTTLLQKKTLRSDDNAYLNTNTILCYRNDRCCTVVVHGKSVERFNRKHPFCYHRRLITEDCILLHCRYCLLLKLVTRTTTTTTTTMKIATPPLVVSISSEMKSIRMYSNGLISLRWMAGILHAASLRVILDFSSQSGNIYPKVRTYWCVHFASNQPAPHGNILTHYGGPASTSDCDLFPNKGTEDIYRMCNIITFDQRCVGRSIPSFYNNECMTKMPAKMPAKMPEMKRVSGSI